MRKRRQYGLSFKLGYSFDSTKSATPFRSHLRNIFQVSSKSTSGMTGRHQPWGVVRFESNQVDLTISPTPFRGDLRNIFQESCKLTSGMTGRHQLWRVVRFDNICNPLSWPPPKYFLSVLKINFRCDGSTLRWFPCFALRNLFNWEKSFDSTTSSTPISSYLQNIFLVSFKSTTGKTGRLKLRGGGSIRVESTTFSTILDICETLSTCLVNWLPVCVSIQWEMVYQISGITRRINRESTSGRTIRKLPLTNRSGLGVLHNPRYTVSEKLRIIQFAK